MRQIWNFGRFVRLTIVSLALLASLMVASLAMLGFLFIAATSTSDPDEKDLPLFAFLLAAALASGLVAFWSATLPHRKRPWRVGLTASAILIAVLCAGGMVAIKSDPDARLGSVVQPLPNSRVC
ncbi:hypothetical protein JOD31_002217 [Methylopila capsulata]|uniref:Uncharacterized protein n=1 Tax=Methylopila capsulata TaxID=61654 RepID=A0A9W6ISX2_9HYPH|nr:hypothetical protein [Methylopila capsulata]MBM7851992.1 hypothetical protein [Methylopila capsulata]GLK55057.1 hypothetical protein GCM10008170_10760 [Methylopila capsulata]